MSQHRHVLERVVVATSLSFALLACAAKGTAPVAETSDGPTIVAEGQRTGTDQRSVMFKGRVSYRTSGHVLPLSNVTFTRQDTPDRNPTVLEIPVDDEGRFEVELVLVTTVTNHRKRKTGTIVVVDSPGCSSLTLQVSDDWKPRTLELTCEFR